MFLANPYILQSPLRSRQLQVLWFYKTEAYRMNLIYVSGLRWVWPRVSCTNRTLLQLVVCIYTRWITIDSPLQKEEKSRSFIHSFLDKYCSTLQIKMTTDHSQLNATMSLWLRKYWIAKPILLYLKWACVFMWHTIRFMAAAAISNPSRTFGTGTISQEHNFAQLLTGEDIDAFRTLPRGWSTIYKAETRGAAQKCSRHEHTTNIILFPQIANYLHLVCKFALSKSIWQP